MHYFKKLLANVILFFLAFLVAIVVIALGYDRATIASNPRITPGSPLMILLDNSGSMGKCSVRDDLNNCVLDAEKPYKIDVVKQQLKSAINQSKMSTTEIGLTEFGNYKAYGLTKDKRCYAAKRWTVPELDNREQINDALEKKIQANDSGATPLAWAINHTVQSLRKEKSLPARLLVVTDGEPNCNEEYSANLCGIIATHVKDPSKEIEFFLDIVGYKAQDNDTEFTNCAKRFPDIVRYWGSASNPEELDEFLVKVLDQQSPNPSAPSTSITEPSISKGTEGCEQLCIFKTCISFALLSSGLTAIIIFAILLKGKIRIAAITTTAVVVGALAAAAQLLPCN